jgi:hypothetical protein
MVLVHRFAARAFLTPGPLLHRTRLFYLATIDVRHKRIFAFHRASGEPKEVELISTRDAMRARGPDGAGLWWSRNRAPTPLDHRSVRLRISTDDN